MLSILCVRLTIKVKVGIPESFKVGRYPPKKTGSSHLKFTDRDPYWYSRRVKEAIHVRLHLNNINRDSGIEIPKAWMPTIRQHDNRSLPQGTAEGSVDGLLTVANITDPKMQGRDGSKHLAKKVNLRSLGLHCDYSY